MKSLFLLALIIFSSLSGEFAEASLFDSKIGGVIKSNAPGERPLRVDGTLLIEAYHENQKDKVFASTKVVNPTFPQSFLLGPKNTAVKGVPFQGPFQIRAKFIESSGENRVYLYGESNKKIPVTNGKRNIEILIK